MNSFPYADNALWLEPQAEIVSQFLNWFVYWTTSEAHSRLQSRNLKLKPEPLQCIACLGNIPSHWSNLTLTTGGVRVIYTGQEPTVWWGRPLTGSVIYTGQGPTVWWASKVWGDSWHSYLCLTDNERIICLFFTYLVDNSNFSLKINQMKITFHQIFIHFKSYKWNPEVSLDTAR